MDFEKYDNLDNNQNTQNNINNEANANMEQPQQLTQQPQQQQQQQQQTPPQNFQQYSPNLNNNPMYNQNNKPHPKYGFCVASLVLGIISIVFSCCIPFLNLVIAILGLVFGIIGQKAQNNGLAIAGIITSSITIVISLFLIISAIIVIIFGGYNVEYNFPSIYNGIY